MKLVFEIAVDQQTRARCQTFEYIFGPIMTNHISMHKTMLMGTLPVLYL